MNNYSNFNIQQPMNKISKSMPKFLFIWLLLGFVPLIVMAVFIYYVTPASTQHLIHSENHTAAAITADLIKNEFIQKASLVSTALKSPELISAINEHNESTVRDYLKILVESKNQIIRAYVTDTTGLLWSDYPIAAESLGKNFNFRDWFKGISTYEGPYLSEVYLRNAEPKLPVVALAVRIRNVESKNVGYMVLQVGLEELTRSLRHIKIGHDGYTILLDHTGTIAAHPDTTIDLTQRLYDEYAKTVVFSKDDSSIVKDYEYSDPVTEKLMLAAVSTCVIFGHNWTVVAQQSSEEAWRPVRVLKYLITGSGLLVTIIMSFLIGGIYRYQNRNLLLNTNLSQVNLELRQENLVRLQAEEDVRKANQELESKVETRTRELHTSEQRFRQILDGMLEGFQIIDKDWKYVYLNDTIARQGKQGKYELLGKTMMECYPSIEHTELFTMLDKCMRERQPHHMENEFVFPDGSKGWFELSIQPSAEGIFILTLDITEYKNAIEDLKASESRVNSIIDNSSDLIFVIQDNRLVMVNRAMELISGLKQEQLTAQDFDLFATLDTESKEILANLFSRHVKGEKIDGLYTLKVLSQNEKAMEIEANYTSITWNGRPALMGIARDVTVQRSLEEQLAQAQKMEAIGRLAGGVAHDFNNLLTIITGCSEFVLSEMPETNPWKEDILEIRNAGDRAASLTRQLLAFSRQQVLQPKILDVNEVVGRMDKMLQRVIGEDIDFVTNLRPNLYPVKVDPGQVEQIVMNLAVNARDAMPHGGKLTLETANIEISEEYVKEHTEAKPGTHVMIALTDTGVGMDEATKAKIFEPFFTTKSLGHGTGRGLSTVFGIVKQSGGNIWVYSEIGHGTTFKIYLPKAASSELDTDYSVGSAVTIKGTETILVVEDEEGVRNLVRRSLERGGYHVLEADSAAKALDICDHFPDQIHALLTDVVLPQTGGRELAEKIKLKCHDIKVIYMSGYTDNAIVHHGVLDPGTNFIEKPITPSVLLEKMRKFLAI